MNVGYGFVECVCVSSEFVFQLLNEWLHLLGEVLASVLLSRLPVVYAVIVSLPHSSPEFVDKSLDLLPCPESIELRAEMIDVQMPKRIPLSFCHCLVLLHLLECYLAKCFRVLQLLIYPLSESPILVTFFEFAHLHSSSSPCVRMMSSTASRVMTSTCSVS